MNNEKEVNENLNNNGSMDAMSLGAVPTPEAPSLDSPSMGNQTPVTNDNPAQSVDSLNPTDGLATPSEAVNQNNLGEETLATATTESVTPNPTLTNAGPSVMGNNINNNLGPIEQPIPGTTSYTATSNINSNAFVETNKAENVGAEPPVQKEPKPKKPMNKLLFIILILVLLGAIAYGVYYYLSLGKKSNEVSVTPKNVEVSLNETLSTNIADYATIKGTDAKNCQINTENVDVTTAGNYEYTITCGNDKYTGIVKIVDNAPIIATPKDVYAVLTTEGNATEYVADNFVEPDSCSGTDCVYSFAEDIDLASLLQMEGTHEINIMIKSSDGKEGVVSSSLIVLTKPIRYFLDCSAPVSESTTGSVTDHIAIGANDNNDGYVFINYAYRTTIFTFDNMDAYKEVAGSKNPILTYNNVTGQATYDDTASTITIRSELTIDALNSDAGGTFPIDYPAITSYYQGRNYSCQPRVIG